MKKLFLLAWPIALAAVSCSNEEVVSVNNDANEIKFTAVAENATRANTTETFCNYKLPGDFKVWACTNNGKSYFEGVTYTETSGEWKAPAENLRFWPNKSGESLDFYAMRNYGTLTSWDADGTAKIVTNFTVEDDVASQLDFIYAVATKQTKPAATEDQPHKGDVALNFRHALSQIVFKARNTNKNLAVKITNVGVINVANTATCTLPTASTDLNCTTHTTPVNVPNSVCTWSGWGDAKKDYSVDTKECMMTGETSTDVDLTNSVDADDNTRNFDKSMLLIPQTIVKAAIGKDEANKPSKIATEGTGSMIAVTCQIWNLNTANDKNGDDVELFNSVAYIPLEAITWEPGKKYIYTLVFGKANGGYDGDGNDVLVPVSFTVTVDDFTPVVEKDVNMNL